MLALHELPSFCAPDHLNVVVETSQGSPNKLKWEPKCNAFRLSSVLPAGSVFPYDFGFIPGTLGPDGDPLDVLLLLDEPVPTGCVVEARTIGVIEAEQTESDGSIVRNDRVLAVAVESHRHRDVRALKDLEAHLLDEIEHFFVSYDEMQGKKFRPLARRGPSHALKLIRDAMETNPANGQR